MKRTYILLGLLLICSSIMPGPSEGSDMINILPTPKSLKQETGKVSLASGEAVIVLGKRASDMSRYGADEIISRVSAMTGGSIRIINEGESGEPGLKQANLILIGTAEENGLLARYLQQTPASGRRLDKMPASGYIITPVDRSGRTVYLLAGKDAQGALYACISFSQLIRTDNGNPHALRAAVEDWPDLYNRGITVTPPDSRRPIKDALPYLDWCLRHKIDMVSVNLWGFTNGNKTVPAEKDVSWLRAFNDGAAARGIQTMGLMLYTSIGYVPHDKDNPAFKDCNIAGGAYWSWGRDDLIAAKAEKSADFIAKAGFPWFVFHFRDGSPTEYWSDRDRITRNRFGDDRAAATANQLNIIYKAVKLRSPKTRLVFAVEPYYGQLNLPENAAYRQFFAKLTKLIPEDVWLVNADWSRDCQDSWKEVVKQPVCHWRNVVHCPLVIGRDFSSEIRFAIKSGYYPKSRDIIFINQHISYENSEDPNVLQAAEYMWNVNAPGTEILYAKKGAQTERYVEDLYNLPRMDVDSHKFHDWLWNKSTVAPPEISQSLLSRICEELYGAEAAPMMAQILRMGIARRSLLRIGRYNAPPYTEIFHNPDIIKEQYQRAEKAWEMLAAFKEQGKDFKTGGGFMQLETFISNMKTAALGGKVNYHLLVAEKLAKEGKVAQARASMKSAGDAMAAAEKELPAWRCATWLAALDKAYKSLDLRLSLMQSRQNDGTGRIKVAIYNPNDSGGLVVGQNAIYTTLLKSRDMEPVFISSLKEASFYDCLIIPSCKRFAGQDNGTFLLVEKEVWEAEAAVRDLVIRDGRGVLLYHDSVGYNRFPMKRSIFPEFCTGANRIESSSIKVSARHPLAQGLEIDRSYEIMYYDHIAMQRGQAGTTVCVNDYGDAVLIAGELGRGRVVLNGAVPYLKTGEPQEAAGIDRDLLISSIYWLVGKQPNTVNN
ncbi:MAG TPA: hypothetical protein DCL60_07860 [Armatimonadetes bacterium]|jgi:hypothetical protein|nr:hypothetical protein [Armatimonadota bacterium]